MDAPIRKDGQVLKGFIEQARQLDVLVFDLSDGPALNVWLTKIKEESGFHHIWLDSSLGILPPVLEEALGRLGLLRALPLEPWDAKNSPNIALGIARADFGVAYSGSLAFIKASALITLVPVGLLALLNTGSIVPSYEELFSLLCAPYPRNLCLITGPSQTSDIEKKLIKGVHGPKWVAILLENPPD
jgi:L-lactate utilization protein LutC